MGRKCSVPGCRTGYTKKKPNVSVFRFPRNLEDRQKWTLAIPRDYFQPTEHVGVCSLHFQEGDIDHQSRDSNIYRIKAAASTRSSVPKVKPGVVPSIFPPMPDSPARETRQIHRKPAGPAFRIKEEFPPKHEIIPANFLAQDAFDSWEEMESMVDLSLFPSIFHQRVAGGSLFFSLEQVDQPPGLDFSLMVHENLTFDLWIGSMRLLPSKYRDIVEDQTLSSWSQVLNLLAWAQNFPKDRDSGTLAHCIALIQTVIPQVSEEDQQKLRSCQTQLSSISVPAQAK